MKRTAAAFVVVGLILAGCGDDDGGTVSGSASTSGTSSATGTRSQSGVAAPSGELGGYQPVSDVAQHAKVSEDVCDINALLDASPIDFAAVGAIYGEGKYSVEGDGSKRSLGEFARAARSGEELLGRYERHFGVGWLDAFVSAAIGGTGAFAGEADAVRRQGVQKGTRNQVLVAWVFHELDAAVEKAKNGNFDAATGAPHNWDEVRAYYHGEKPECAPYATADERGAEFGTGSALNEAILADMRRGLDALQAKDAEGAAKARDEVVRKITITYVQSAIKYSANIDAALEQGKMDEARIYQAEGWAYFRVIEPLVAGVDAAVARTVADVFDLEASPAQGSGERVAGALAKAYEGLGIRTSEVGKYHAS